MPGAKNELRLAGQLFNANGGRSGSIEHANQQEVALGHLGVGSAHIPGVHAYSLKSPYRPILAID
jgi:hypothetical protein